MKDSKLVWTSDPEEARRLRESGETAAARDLEPAKQTIRVTLDRKRRAGKTVTVASGFSLTPESLARLATQLKKRCGAGGAARQGEVEVQGEHLELVSEELRRMGYRVR
jgi:translation initiation factor 1